MSHPGERERLRLWYPGGICLAQKETPHSFDSLDGCVHAPAWSHALWKTVTLRKEQGLVWPSLETNLIFCVSQWTATLEKPGRKQTCRSLMPRLEGGGILAGSCLHSLTLGCQFACEHILMS